MSAKILRIRWIIAGMMGLFGLACGMEDRQTGGGETGAETAASTAGAHDHGAHAGEVSIKPYAGAYPIKIVTTTGMIADIARKVGGEQVEVKALMGEGVDPHLYKATPGDIDLMRGADLILYNGLHLEGKMADILAKLGERQPAYAVTHKIPEARLRKPPEFQGNFDPHLWFDVALWGECAAFVTELLTMLDAKNEAEYRRRGEAYAAELAQLDAFAREQIATIPKESRLMVTAHDAFGYFGSAYDIEVLAIQGISTESEAGVYKVNELVNTIVMRKVKAVFVETSVSDKNIRALVEGCQARGHELKIGGSLFSDAMGGQGTREGTYVGMVRHNVETVVAALK